MSSSSSDTTGRSLSTYSIVAAVVGLVFSIILCAGCLVAVICIIKHINKSKGAVNGMILQPYPANPNNFPNYPPPYPPPPPPMYSYTAPNPSSEAEFSKIPNY